MKIFQPIIGGIKKLFKYLWGNKFLAIFTIIGIILVLIVLFFLSIFLFPDLAKIFGTPDGKGKNYDYASHQTDVIHLDQGWGEGFRHQFYFTPQGSHIIPLDIALALEGPDSEQLFFGDGGLAVTKFGYLPYPKTEITDEKTEHTLNPYGLPLGFTVDGYIEAKYAATNKNKTPMLGMNCAACHTSDMRIQGKTVRIDGNQALGDFMGLLTAMDNALAKTLTDNDKFDRFSARIIPSYEGSATLQQRLRETLEYRDLWQRRNAPDLPAGHGRVDAFGVIFNQVTANNLHKDTRDVGGNARAPNAPVSYPVLWDTPHMARVQWNGSANNKKSGGVLGRNFGQVLGVFGDTEVTRNNALLGNCSTVKRPNLNLMDYWIRSLESPQWSDPALSDLLPALDADLVEEGAALYAGKAKCISCHATVPEGFRGTPAKRKSTCDLPITMVDADIVKTDQATVLTGERIGAKTGPLSGLKSRARDGEYILPEEPYANVLREVVTRSIIGSFQTLTCEGITEPKALIDATAGFGTIYKSKKGKGDAIGDGFDYKPAQEAANIKSRDANADSGEEVIRDPDSECGPDKMKYIYARDKDVPKGSYHPHGYRARPLNGIWASAPYLHNGSVPTLYDMLRPPAPEGECAEGKECRPTIFYVGNPEYDPVKGGYVSGEKENLTRYNTKFPGNGNGGHLFGTSLSPGEKAALLEYLKSL